METDQTFRIAFFVLLGGLLLMRIYFALRLRQVGGRFMPDQKAIERDGRGMFLARVVAFFVLLALVIIAGLAVRVPREEKMMVEEFGDKYRAYMQSTGRLFPKFIR